MTATQLTPLAADALAGLWHTPPSLPTKWLYDERGSALFDEITRLPEYYPTRTEAAILTARAGEIADATAATMMVELGSGTSTKTRLLLDAFSANSAAANSAARNSAANTRAPFTYVPVDVSAETVTRAAHTLTVDYPSLQITPVVADFTGAGLTLPTSCGPRVVVFLGGTIGNFDAEGRKAFFEQLATAAAPGDYLLLGADLIKDTERLLAAYNDAAGVTADFNRNLIEVLRSGLDARGLYADDFDHIARWNSAEHRIEMWLRTRRGINAYFSALDRAWQLPAGAEIHTEISTKFTREGLSEELTTAGFASVRAWTDSADDFLLLLAQR